MQRRAVVMHGRLVGGAGGVACFIQEDDAFQNWFLPVGRRETGQAEPYLTWQAAGTVTRFRLTPTSGTAGAA